MKFRIWVEGDEFWYIGYDLWLHPTTSPRPLLLFLFNHLSRDNFCTNGAIAVLFYMFTHWNLGDEFNKFWVKPPSAPPAHSRAYFKTKML